MTTSVFNKYQVTRSVFLIVSEWEKKFNLESKIVSKSLNWRTSSVLKSEKKD
jgi:hypothetical protein